MSRWFALPILLGLAACSAPHSTQVRKEAQQPFITETAIDVPERTKSAELVNATRAGEAGAGIQASYRAALLPDSRVDLFIYPAGRAPEKEALAFGVQGFLESVAYAEKQGTYSESAIDSSAPFAATREDNTPLSAHKIAFHMTDHGAMLASRTWIAYKQNYWFKLRMTAAQASAATLDEEGDPLARELFAKAAALSKGSCADTTVTLSRDDLADSTTVADAIFEAASRQQRAGCTHEEYPRVAPGFRRVMLPFPPGFWGPPPDAV